MLTIIIVNLNNDSGLQKTLASLVNQDNLEGVKLVVMDGGSTDKSKEVMASFRTKFLKAEFVSEPDEGITGGNR